MQAEHDSDHRPDSAEYQRARGGALATRARLVWAADADAKPYSDSHANCAADRRIARNFALTHYVNGRDVLALDRHGLSI